MMDCLICRFLEMVQLDAAPQEITSDSSHDTSQHKVCPSALQMLPMIHLHTFPVFLNLSLQASYDTELQALHSMIQQKVVVLLSDPDNIVKHTLLQAGITRLCVFFGRQKGIFPVALPAFGLVVCLQYDCSTVFFQLTTFLCPI